MSPGDNPKSLNNLALIKTFLTFPQLQNKPVNSARTHIGIKNITCPAVPVSFSNHLRSSKMNRGRLNKFKFLNVNDFTLFYFH